MMMLFEAPAHLIDHNIKRIPTIVRIGQCFGEETASAAQNQTVLIMNAAVRKIKWLS